MQIDIEKIISLRNHHGITQEDAAKALGIGRTTYLNREKDGGFDITEIEKLAKLLKVKKENLYKDEAKDRLIIEDSISKLTEIATRSESLQVAILLGITKLLSAQTNVEASKILEELTKAANLRSKDFSDQLQRLAER